MGRLQENDSWLETEKNDLALSCRNEQSQVDSLVSYGF